MKTMQSLGLISLSILILVPAAGAVPNVWGQWTWDHTETVHLMVAPGGGGVPLTQAAYFGGVVTDATIRIQLWVQDDMPPDDPPPPAPVANFPAEDIWLAASGLTSCFGGSHPDADTDSDGWFTFSQPLEMGGWTTGANQLRVMVSGNILYDQNDQPIIPDILVNSPDINADGSVDLIDLGLFAEDFYGSYDFRSDFVWDGTLNLADVGRLAATFGGQCSTAR